VAVEAGFSPQTISDLIKLGCDINTRNVDGTTPLHAALLNENEEVFKQLAGLGADPDIKDESGDSVRN
jgi:ankyrin repeat protein